MEFSNLGLHCSMPLCQQQDFLPFSCDACHKIYCKDHRSYFEHSCTSVPMGEEVIKCPACNKGITRIPDMDINVTISMHMDSSECKIEETAKCLKCKIKLTGINSISCARCKQKVCITHRYPDQHPCSHPLERKVQAMGFTCPKCGMNYGKSADMIQHLRFDHYDRK